MQWADVEEVRTLDARELRLGVGVQLRLELAQGRGCCEGRLDRVRALVCGRGVAGGRLEREPGPDHADGHEVESAVRRLRDDDAVCRRAREAGGRAPFPPHSSSITLW
jgi:hypothetical protein